MKLICFILLWINLSIATISAQGYNDGRPVAKLRMDAKDDGIVLKYGDGPDTTCKIIFNQ